MPITSQSQTVSWLAFWTAGRQNCNTLSECHCGMHICARMAV